jgi:excisionase family DNA binding protein
MPPDTSITIPATMPDGTAVNLTFTREALAKLASVAAAEPIPIDGYLSREELAERLGLGVRTITRLVAKWVIPSIKIGRVRRFSLSQVDEALRQRFTATHKRIA